jgi:uncharacterized small protein (DUF1192 family)
MGTATVEERLAEMRRQIEHLEAKGRAGTGEASDLADDRKQFAAAVEDELHNWDTYFERLQAQTALRAANAREQAEAAISDLRKRRNAVAERLADVRSTAGNGWPEQKERIGATRDELERKADELSAKFK